MKNRLTTLFVYFVLIGIIQAQNTDFLDGFEKVYKESLKSIKLSHLLLNTGGVDVKTDIKEKYSEPLNTYGLGLELSGYKSQGLIISSNIWSNFGENKKSQFVALDMGVGVILNKDSGLQYPILFRPSIIIFEGRDSFHTITNYGLSGGIRFYLTKNININSFVSSGINLYLKNSNEEKRRSSHYFQFGMSLNYVFRRRKQEHKKILAIKETNSKEEPLKYKGSVLSNYNKVLEKSEPRYRDFDGEKYLYYILAFQHPQKEKKIKKWVEKNDMVYILGEEELLFSFGDYSEGYCYFIIMHKKDADRLNAHLDKYYKELRIKNNIDRPYKENKEKPKDKKE